MRLLGIVAAVQRGIKTFFDTFTSGFRPEWSSVRSGWTAGSGVATASTSNYPINVIDVGSSTGVFRIVNNTEKSGAGISFWVTDADNWWGLASKEVPAPYTYYYSCNCYTYSYDCNCRDTSYQSCTGGTYQCNCVTGGPYGCLLYTSPSPRDGLLSRMPSSA